MSDAFLSAVIDTILPGESRPQAGESPLPCGTLACLGLDRRADANEHVLGLIAREAGGEAHFVAAAPADRAAILGRVEEQSFEAFRALVSTLLQDYYEAPATLGALGWRASPPQPQGHAVLEADAQTLQRLDNVRARGPIWRPAK